MTGQRGASYSSGTDRRRAAAAQRRADAVGGKIAGARESAWARGHESAKATWLNGLSAGETVKSNGYIAQVTTVLTDHAGGLPRVEVTYPTEPEYGTEVVAGSTIEHQPYALNIKDCVRAEFAVSKENYVAMMKIFKFLDKDSSGSLDSADFTDLRSTRSGEWLAELQKMDRNSDGEIDADEFISFFKVRAAGFATPRPTIYARNLKELGANLQAHFNVALERTIAEAVAFFEVRTPDFQAVWARLGVPPQAMTAGF